MIVETLSAIPGILISGYESLVGTFGSPAMLIAIAGTLVIAAIAELCVRNRRKHAKEAV